MTVLDEIQFGPDPEAASAFGAPGGGDIKSGASAIPIRRAARLRWWHVAVMVAVSVALLSAASSAAGGVSGAYGQLLKADAWWLVPAVVAVGLRFVVIGQQLRLLDGEGGRMSSRLATGISLVTFGLGGVLPASPAEGIAMSVFEMRRRGVPPRRTGLMLLASQWVQFWSLIVVFAVDRVVVAAAGELHHRHPLPTVVPSLLLLGIVTAAMVAARREGVARRVAAAVRWLPGLRHKTPSQLSCDGVLLHRDLKAAFGPRINQTKVFVTAIAAWILDATVLWCALRAMRAPVSIEAAVLAYSVATAVAWVPLLPSGLGLVEIVVPLVLHRFGVPLVTGLAAIALWRAVSLLLPAVAGLVTYVTMRVGVADLGRPSPPPLVPAVQST